MTFAVPWRGGDRWRERTWGYVKTHLENAGPVLTADSGDQPFNRAASRNLAASECDGVMILHDADTIAPADAYPEMIELASDTGRMVVGYTQYRALTRNATRRVLDGSDPWTEELAGTTEGWSLGGIVAITREAWDLVGGMDPRFRGWGCEDTALAHAAAVVLGPILRVPAPAVHLWHPHGSGHADETANGELLARYTACTTPDEIRRLVAERNEVNR